MRYTRTYYSDESDLTSAPWMEKYLLTLRVGPVLLTKIYKTYTKLTVDQRVLNDYRRSGFLAPVV